jgi:hypothetical protein
MGLIEIAQIVVSGFLSPQTQASRRRWLIGHTLGQTCLRQHYFFSPNPN